MIRRGLVFLLSLLAACGGDTEPPGRPTISLRDSLRVRRAVRLSTRPDTFGNRVDSLRSAGSDAASLWIVVVSDFQCRECREFAEQVLPEIRRDFVESGRARLAFVNFPQDANFNARFAAHAALCAASAGRFWQMHDSLFASQHRWQRAPDPQPFFDSLAISAGVPPAVQGDCSGRKRLLPLLSADLERSHSSGVSRVPSVIVGDRLFSGQDLTSRNLRRAIEAALGSK